MTVIRSGDDSPLDPAVLSAAIDRFPEAEKVVMTLAEYEGLTDAEIAATLMESEATVTALHESALQRLAEAVGAPPRSRTP
jgi:DNA-directed RNA polymerase specialized sigma24 family protein